MTGQTSFIGHRKQPPGIICDLCKASRKQPIQTDHLIGICIQEKKPVNKEDGNHVLCASNNQSLTF